jgi:hypothetical protein
LGVPAGLHHRDGEQGAVELAVAAAGQPVAGGVATGGGHGRRAGVGGERGGAGEVADVAGLAQDLAGDQHANTWDGKQVGGVVAADLGGDVAFQVGDLLVEGAQAADGRQRELGPHGIQATGLERQAAGAGQRGRGDERAGVLPVARRDGPQQGVQAVADPALLGDELVAALDQQLEVGVQVRLVHPRQVWFAQGDPGEGDRVDLVVLAASP